MTKIVERIAALRQVMEREGLGAFIFPSTDAHNSEYVADHWKGREWISGFNGSAGTVVVTMDAAALWTDSRYFLAAEEQLRGTDIMLMKLKVEGTPTITDWLVEQLRGASHPVVGLDGWVNGTDEVQRMQAFFQGYDIQVRTDFDPLNEIWTDRPSIPTAKVELHPLEFAGETTESKFARIRESLRSCGAEAMLVSALDDIAWTLNLRGSDVYCNPVFVSYLMIEQESATLFVNEEKLDDAVRRYLSDLGVAVQPYAAVADYLRSHAFEGGLLLDSVKTCYHLASCALKKSVVRFAPSPIPAMKAVKNEAEIAGYRRAMTRDGVAMVKFLRWLQPAVEAGGQTEISLDKKLTALRAGMTVTNEPGIYLSDRFGVRIENTCLIKDYMETELGRFLQMESLTLCPIDLAPVDCSLLTAEEKQWLNDYHQMVCEKLAPHLDGEDLAWLQDHCKPIEA